MNSIPKISAQLDEDKIFKIIGRPNNDVVEDYEVAEEYDTEGTETYTVTATVPATPTTTATATATATRVKQ